MHWTIGSGRYGTGLHGIRSPQGRIQEFILGGANQGPQSKIKGEARIEGAKRPRIEGEAREKTGGRGLGRGLGEPPPQKIFRKIKLETIHFGAYLKQLIEMTNEMV